MPFLNVSNISCGVGELWDLTADPKTLIETVQSSFRGNPREFEQPRHRAIIVFSDHTHHRGDRGFNNSRGQRLMDYIAENNLGEVFRTEPMYNHNSGNQIELFVWKPNREAVLAHNT